MLDKLFPWQRGLLSAGSGDYVTTSQLIETVDALVYGDVNSDDHTKVFLHTSAYFISLFFIIIVFIVSVSSAGDGILVGICVDKGLFPPQINLSLTLMGF